MTEVLLAAEVLVIRVLDPAQSQLLVRQVVRVLEDREASHQAGRQRRLTRAIRVHVAELAADQLPVDQAAEPDQRVLHVDDLVAPRPAQIVLPSRLLARPHPRLRLHLAQTESRFVIRGNPLSRFARKSTSHRGIPATRPPACCSFIPTDQQVASSSRSTGYGSQKTVSRWATCSGRKFTR